MSALNDFIERFYAVGDRYDKEMAEEAAEELAHLQRIKQAAEKTLEYMKRRVASDEGAKMRDELAAALKGASS